MELKIKLFENFFVVVFVMFCCVCLELKFLVFSEELWKVCFKVEFKFDVIWVFGGCGWKVVYV